MFPPSIVATPPEAFECSCQLPASRAPPAITPYSISLVQWIWDPSVHQACRAPSESAGRSARSSNDDAFARPGFGSEVGVDIAAFVARLRGKLRQPKVEHFYAPIARDHDGRPELVLIHIEVQARTELGVNERMFEYYSLLRSRHRLPIFPIVVYLSRGRNP